MVQFFRYLSWEIAIKSHQNAKEMPIYVYICVYSIYMHAFRYLWHATFPIPTYVQTHIHTYGYMHICNHIYMCV